MAGIGNRSLDNDRYLEDIYLSEKEKSSEDYLKDSSDYWISTLVHEKLQIKKYRNYYAGIRGEDEFEHITENFGVGTPSSIRFTNLIKPRIDALVGRMISESYSYSVTCSDDTTVDAINEKKKNERIKDIERSLMAFTQAIANTNEGDEPTLGELQGALSKVQEKYTDNYLSDFEIAAQDLLQFFSQDKHMDLLQKLKQLAMDLLITGECYYRVYCRTIGSDPVLDIVKPENMFYNKNTNSQYIDTSDAVVRREYLTRKDVLRLYGSKMNEEQKEFIYGSEARVRSGKRVRSGYDLDDYRTLETDPVNGQKSFSSLDTIEVFHVEWKAGNTVKIDTEEALDSDVIEEGYAHTPGKVGYRMDRYEVTRIAGCIYVDAGKSRHITRSQTRPYECDFTYSGIVYNDRNGKPYSHVGACMDLQDIFDITNFYRDVMVANSGSSGDRVNIAAIPKVLGANFEERLMKFFAYKKQGFELVDPTEAGAQLFNHYGQFDNSVNGNSLNAIDQLLLSFERQADLNMGTNPQMLGQIAQRDAVTNVKVGIQQSLLINEDKFELLRTSHRRLLSDLVATSQICYKKGKKGSYIAGSEAYVFNIVPEYFCYTDYNINVVCGSKEELRIQELRGVAKELISAGALPPDIIVGIMLSESVTEIQRIVSKATKENAAKMDEVQGLSSENEQLKNQLQELNARVNQLQATAKSNENANIDIRERELKLKEYVDKEKLEIEEMKANATISYNDNKLRLDRSRVDLEREQLYTANNTGKNNAEIRNS